MRAERVCRARRTGAGGTAGRVHRPEGAHARPRRRRAPAMAAAAATIPATTAASATPGDGAAGAGLPLPQVASRQFTGPDRGTSATCATWVAEDSAATSTPCGMKPPTTAAAMIATRPTRQRKDMTWRLRVRNKRAIRITGRLAQAQKIVDDGAPAPLGGVAAPRCRRYRSRRGARRPGARRGSSEPNRPGPAAMRRPPGGATSCTTPESGHEQPERPRDHRDLRHADHLLRVRSAGHDWTALRLTATSRSPCASVPVRPAGPGAKVLSARLARNRARLGLRRCPISPSGWTRTPCGPRPPPAAAARDTPPARSR